jgi:hypothetical protein
MSRINFTVTSLSATVLDMETNSAQLPESREELSVQLAKNRRECLAASERGDFRAVARLTLEAARLNQAIANILPREETR